MAHLLRWRADRQDTCADRRRVGCKPQGAEQAEDRVPENAQETHAGHEAIPGGAAVWRAQAQEQIPARAKRHQQEGQTGRRWAVDVIEFVKLLYMLFFS